MKKINFKINEEHDQFFQKLERLCNEYGACLFEDNGVLNISFREQGNNLRYTTRGALLSHGKVHTFNEIKREVIEEIYEEETLDHSLVIKREEF